MWWISIICILYPESEDYFKKLIRSTAVISFMFPFKKNVAFICRRDLYDVAPDVHVLVIFLTISDVETTPTVLRWWLDISNIFTQHHDNFKFRRPHNVDHPTLCRCLIWFLTRFFNVGATSGFHVVATSDHRRYKYIAYTLCDVVADLQPIIYVAPTSVLISIPSWFVASP